MSEEQQRIDARLDKEAAERLESMKVVVIGALERLFRCVGPATAWDLAMDIMVHLIVTKPAGVGLIGWLRRHAANQYSKDVRHIVATWADELESSWIRETWWPYPDERAEQLEQK